MKMNNDFKLLEIVHTQKESEFKMGITIDTKYYTFLEELHNQYGNFHISKEEGDLQLITD